jgi:hypothetical protein
MVFRLWPLMATLPFFTTSRTIVNFRLLTKKAGLIPPCFYDLLLFFKKRALYLS